MVKKLNEFVDNINTGDSGYNLEKYVGIIKYELTENIIDKLSEVQDMYGNRAKFSQPINSSEWTSKYKGNDLVYLLSMLAKPSRIDEVSDAIDTLISPTLSNELGKTMSALGEEFRITDDIKQYLCVHSKPNEENMVQSEDRGIIPNIIPVNATTTYFIIASEDEDEITDWQANLIESLPVTMSSVSNIEIMTYEKWVNEFAEYNVNNELKKYGLDNRKRDILGCDSY